MTTDTFRQTLDSYRDISLDSIKLLEILFNCIDPTFDSNLEFANCVRNADTSWFQLSAEDRLEVALKVKQRLPALADASPRAVCARITGCLNKLRNNPQFIEEALRIAKEHPEDLEHTKRTREDIFPHLFDDEA